MNDLLYRQQKGLHIDPLKDRFDRLPLTQDLNNLILNEDKKEITLDESGHIIIKEKLINLFAYGDLEK